MWIYFSHEVDNGANGEEAAKKIGYPERSDFGDISPAKHSYAESYIPRGEVGAGGCPSLTVGGQVDKEGVVGGKHGSESYSEQKGDYEEEKGGLWQGDFCHPSAGCQPEKTYGN